MRGIYCLRQVSFSVAQTDTTLTLAKEVINDNGGDLAPSGPNLWILIAENVTNFPSFLIGEGSSVSDTVSPGIYRLSEDSSGALAWYAGNGSWKCIGGTQTRESLEW